MKVCILSDSHDNIPLMKAAAEAAHGMGVEAILHCGDVVAPSTLECLQPLGLPLHVIHGNNTGDLMTMTRVAGREDSTLQFYGQDAGIELCGRKIFLVHYPHYAQALATTGDWDLVCCGHSHKVLIQDIPNMKGGKTVVANPGTVGGVGSKPATWILADLENMQFEIQQMDKDSGEPVPWTA